MELCPGNQDLINRYLQCWMDERTSGEHRINYNSLELSGKIVHAKKYHWYIPDSHDYDVDYVEEGNLIQPVTMSYKGMNISDLQRYLQYIFSTFKGNLLFRTYPEVVFDSDCMFLRFKALTLTDEELEEYHENLRSDKTSKKKYAAATAMASYFLEDDYPGLGEPKEVCCLDSPTATGPIELDDTNSFSDHLNSDFIGEITSYYMTELLKERTSGESTHLREMAEEMDEAIDTFIEAELTAKKQKEEFFSIYKDKD